MTCLSRILIIGGYGRFGGQVAKMLADRGDTTLLIAGRSLEKAAVFCADLKVAAQLVPMAFDREGDLLGQISAAAPDLIIDASGPFQIYGRDPYRVVKAALTCSICYIDLADGADFVAGITVFDDEAKARGFFILSGVSSYPALTAAAVDELARDMVRIDGIWTGIAPSPRAGFGLNVVRAIASYAGKPIKIRHKGEIKVAHALTETRRATIAPPRYLPLSSRRFALVDAPDLQVLSHRWPSLRSAWAGAGVEPDALYLLLIGAAWLVRLRLLRSLSPVAALMHRCLNLWSWGEHRSGMIVVVTGVDQTDHRVDRSWHLLAEGDAGPIIPAMASAALIGRCDHDGRPKVGARPAIADLMLSDFRPFFDRFDIRWGVRHAGVSGPLYQRLLGAGWERLPAILRAMHD